MTLHAVKMPTWGLAMEEGTVASWLVAAGTLVAPGDAIAEIETSKIANVLEAAAAGTLARLIAGEGEVRMVGALLGVISDAGEDDAAIDAFVAGYVEQASTEEKAPPPKPVMAEIAGRSFRYLRLAPADDTPGARPVVLIHGFGGDLASWMFNQAALAVDRPTYAIDLPGHGGSTKHIDDASLAGLAEQVVAWIGTMGRGRVHLVGHSMGAAVALTLALEHPDRVKSLTAISGVGFGGTLDRGYVEGFLSAPRRRELKPVVERLFADPVLVTREMLDDLIAARRIDGAAEALRALADNALSDASVAALAVRVGSIAVPLLRIAGSADQIVSGSPYDGALVVPAGHMPHLEAAAAVNAAIGAFLRTHD